MPQLDDTLKMSLTARIVRSDFYYYFTKDKAALISAIILLIILLIALFTPWIAPHNPYDLATLDILDSDMPPSWIDGGDPRFLFGTDALGRGILSTILYGMRLSLLIGFLAVALQMSIGIVLGLLAGYYGGRFDSFLMRLADIQLSFSTMMIAIIILAIVQSLWGTDVYSRYAVLILVVVIGVSEWPHYARTIRSTVLTEKKKEYVESAQLVPVSNFKIMFSHILPNCLSPILVIATVQIANAIITESALSFLGLGIPPTQPSLGSLIASGFEYLLSGSWWITMFPGIALLIVVLVINLLGDFLRDFFNPQLRN